MASELIVASERYEGQVVELTMGPPPPLYGAPPPLHAAKPSAGLVAMVDLKLCVGCSVCAEDCPYDAITMRPLAEAKRVLERTIPAPAAVAQP